MFSDLTAEDLILRNLATLTDLTVCLDKRNASGKIENYQVYIGHLLCFHDSWVMLWNEAKLRV